MASVPSLCEMLCKMTDAPLLSVHDLELEIAYPDLKPESLRHAIAPICNVFPNLRILRLLPLYRPTCQTECPSVRHLLREAPGIDVRSQYIVQMLQATCPSMTKLRWAERLYVRECDMILDSDYARPGTWRLGTEDDKLPVWPKIIPL